MSETLQIWLFAAAFAGIIGIGGFCQLLNNKFIRFESRLDMTIELWGKKAAKFLHSPTNHLGMDELLDKFLDRYYEMSWKEWTELHEKCLATENDEKATEGERIYAAGLGIICEHRLHMLPRQKRYGKKLVV